MKDKPYKVSTLEGGINFVEHSNECKIYHLDNESDVMFVPEGHKVEKICGNVFISYPTFIPEKKTELDTHEFIVMIVFCLVLGAGLAHMLLT